MNILHIEYGDDFKLKGFDIGNRWWSRLQDMTKQWDEPDFRLNEVEL